MPIFCQEIIILSLNICTEDHLLDAFLDGLISLNSYARILFLMENCSFLLARIRQGNKAQDVN